jgi:hypothetical protein
MSNSVKTTDQCQLQDKFFNCFIANRLGRESPKTHHEIFQLALKSRW